MPFLERHATGKLCKIFMHFKCIIVNNFFLADVYIKGGNGSAGSHWK